MKRISLLIAALLIAVSALSKEKMEPWQDPNIFEENRMPMSATFVTDQQQTLSLDGIWKFNFNETIEGRTRGFEAPSYDDSDWDTIPVPGMWELNGFGDPLYLNIGYPWRGHYANNPPYPALEHNYVGQYRRTFQIDKSWLGRQICLNIGSATSNVRVWVNGRMVGYSEDSKLEARFDLTRYVKAGENVIALEIFRWCDGTYLEDQDFWRFSGIARGVYLYTRERERIEDVHIVADMNGFLTVDTRTTKGIQSVSYEVLDPAGKSLGTFTGSGKQFQDVSLWSAETPALYTLKVTAQDRRGGVVESTSIRFGFRTVEIKNRQLLVNGRPVLIKGVNRHEMNPKKGYVVSEADMLKDIRIFKELNVNAVRTSHYPNDPRWYDLCDEYGIYVVDEANVESHGMGYDSLTLANRDDFAAAHLVRNQRVVMRDFNHPSVIVWSLGNEGGNGKNFYACYDWIKAYDKTRPVMYERAEDDRNTDLKCPMYMSPDDCEKYAIEGTKPLIQCEYAHAMGNSMGNFKEYWDLIRKYPSFQGGFIWDFVDQAIRWPSREGGTDHIFAFGGDFNQYDPSDGSFNSNGVIAADRSLHPHAYEVRYQYRNILTSGHPATDGKIRVYNEHFFKDLSNYRMQWSLVADGIVVETGIVEDLDVAPQQTREIRLPLPDGRRLDTMGERGDIYLNVSYQLKRQEGLLAAGTEVAYDQLLLRACDRPVFMAGSAAVPENPVRYEVTEYEHLFSGLLGRDGGSVGIWEASFDRGTGALSSYKLDGSELIAEPLMPCFSRAPVENDMGARIHEALGVWRYPEFEVKSMTVQQQGDGYSVRVVYLPVANGAATVEMSYRIHPDGSIAGIEEMKDSDGKLSEAPDLFRFGMTFTMPGTYSIVDFYGKGPWENYCDRNSAALVGRYTQSVNDQYHYGYVRTQESGTKTGLRYFRLLDSDGSGLEITSDEKFSASALPFSIAMLDCVEHGTPERANPTNVQAGEARHSLNFKAIAHENDRENGKTYVNFDLKQMGVGGIDSWGAWPLEPYRIHAAEREFRFILRPIVN